MKEIKSYETEDGLIFKNKIDAIHHDEELRFLKSYEGNEVHRYGTGSDLRGEDIMDWLRDNEGMILQFLGAITNKPGK